MYKLVSSAWIDENSDGVVSLGDIFGFLAINDSGNDAWVPAMGISITKMVDGYPVLTFYDEHTVEAFEKAKKLYLDNPGSLVVNNYDGGNSEFIAGDQLFVRAKFVDAESFRNMQNKYGVLPLPKFDEAQDDYHTTFHNSASLVVVLSTCTELEKVGATLELMAAEAYKQVTPAYFEVCLQGKYSNSPDDAAMYDRIISSFKYDFGMCYSTKSIGGVGALFRDLNKDLAHTYESNTDKYETALDTLVDKLDEISFIAG